MHELGTDAAMLVPIPQHASSHGFRPVFAHATHPDSYRFLMHKSTASHNSFFDAFATDLSESDALIMPTDSSFSPSLTIKTTTRKLLRPRTKIYHLNATRAERMAFNSGIEWEDVDVEVPDINDRETLKTLAKMTSNAYVLPDSTEWWGLDEWNHVSCEPATGEHVTFSKLMCSRSCADDSLWMGKGRRWASGSRREFAPGRQISSYGSVRLILLFRYALFR
jgi:hypothetical protein